MKKQITSMAKDLGVSINFNADKNLRNYEQGPILTVDELRALPNGAIVWAWYKKDGADRPRINSAWRITKMNDTEEYWDLEDGSSFGAGFSPSYGSGDCIDDKGEGEMKLFHALPKQKRR
jgi:hypothetical protein